MRCHLLLRIKLGEGNRRAGMETLLYAGRVVTTQGRPQEQGNLGTDRVVGSVWQTVK